MHQFQLIHNIWQTKKLANLIDVNVSGPTFLNFIWKTVPFAAVFLAFLCAKNLSPAHYYVLGWNYLRISYEIDSLVCMCAFVCVNENMFRSVK